VTINRYILPHVHDSDDSDDSDERRRVDDVNSRAATRSGCEAHTVPPL